MNLGGIVNCLQIIFEKVSVKEYFTEYSRIVSIFDKIMNEVSFFYLYFIYVITPLSIILVKLHLLLCRSSIFSISSKLTLIVKKEK